MSLISVVVPALDEGPLIAQALASVRHAAEVIVVDGGSSDDTAAVASRHGALVIASPPGRGLQLQAGAARARGEWIVFLHADTRLEDGWAEELRSLAPAAVGGAFRFAVDSPRRRFRALESVVAARCRMLSLPYGDQALFVRRDAYLAIGGFRPLPLMEDVDFVRRLSRLAPLSLLHHRAFTSARRWERHGFLRTTLRNLQTLALYAAGWPPARLARRYQGA